MMGYFETGIPVIGILTFLQESSGKSTPILLVMCGSDTGTDTDKAFDWVSAKSTSESMLIRV